MAKAEAAPRSDKETATLDPDRPIARQTDDRFRRAEFASVIARHVARAPKDQSLVFSLLGPWGAGKTSVLHMIEEELSKEKIDVIWFNPWLFSGTEQIASQFMRELAVQLGAKEREYKRVGELIENYGTMLEVGGKLFSGAMAATLGPLASIIGQIAGAGISVAVGKTVQSVERESVRDTRKRLEDALRDTGRRFVVFVDDIDRLDGDEIRTIFKLVRLVADFPNVCYVLAFDRPRVERALSSDDTTGRAYLEKVVQAAFDLPPIDFELLTRVLLEDLDACLSGREHGKLHEREWPDIFLSVIAPLVRTPRDARRFVNAVGPAVDMVGGEVALEDVLALEAIRVFLPDVFNDLPQHIELLTIGQFGSRRSWRSNGDEEAKRQLEGLISRAGDRVDVVRELLKRVFMPARHLIDNITYADDHVRVWRRQRRAAYRDVFEFYLERSLRSGAVRSAIVRQLVDHFSDANAVDEILAKLTGEQVEAAIRRLEDSTEQLAKTDFEQGLVSVLRHADRLRRGRSHMLDFGADMAVARLLLWTLKRAPADRRLPAVKTVLTASSSFTWRIELLQMLGPRKSDAQGLIDTDELTALSDGLKSEIVASQPERLAAEREPGHVVQFAAYDESTKTYNAWANSMASHATFARSLLRTAVHETRRMSMDSAVSRITKYLHLKGLEALAGGEQQLRAMLQRAIDAGAAPPGDEQLATALALAADFLAGKKMYDPNVFDPADENDDSDDDD